MIQNFEIILNYYFKKMVFVEKKQKNLGIQLPRLLKKHNEVLEMNPNQQ